MMQKIFKNKRGEEDEGEAMRVTETENGPDI